MQFRQSYTEGVISLLAVLVGLLLGLLFGSFLNVCIARVPRGLSVVEPRSRCESCGHPVRPYDNIPVLSWLILGGRCRDCRAAISWQYPVVELLMGVWGMVAGLQIAAGPGATSWDYLVSREASFFILGFLLFGLIVIDWQHQRLPDGFTFTGIAAGLFIVCLRAVFLGPKDDQIVLNGAKQLRLSSPGSFAARGNVFLTGPESLIFGRLAAIVGAALALLLVRWMYRAVRKQEGLGLGDVKMLAMVAALLGFWPAMLTLFLGVMLAATYGIWLLMRSKAGGTTRLPLGSFLGAGGLVTALFGEEILNWYRGLL